MCSYVEELTIHPPGNWTFYPIFFEIQFRIEFPERGCFAIFRSSRNEIKSSSAKSCGGNWFLDGKLSKKSRENFPRQRKSHFMASPLHSTPKEAIEITKLCSFRWHWNRFRFHHSKRCVCRKASSKWTMRMERQWSVHLWSHSACSMQARTGKRSFKGKKSSLYLATHNSHPGPCN